MSDAAWQRHASKIRRYFFNSMPTQGRGGDPQPAPIKSLDALVAEIERLRAWQNKTMPVIGALAIYGEDASLPALVKKAKELAHGKP